MSDELAELRRLSRERTSLIWELAQAGGELEEEDARLAEVLDQHPEYYDVWKDRESLEPGTVDEEGVNPYVHVATHTVVENQLAEGDPPETREALEALLEAGYSRHDAIHGIGAVVVREIYGILKEERCFDREAYIASLRDLIQTGKSQARRGSRGERGRRG